MFFNCNIVCHIFHFDLIYTMNYILYKIKKNISPYYCYYTFINIIHKLQMFNKFKLNKNI